MITYDKENKNYFKWRHKNKDGNKKREQSWIYQLSTKLFSLALNSSEPNRFHLKTMK